MLKGILAPKINDILLPEMRTFVKLVVKPTYSDSESANGVLHRIFEFNESLPVFKRTFTVNVEKLTNDEINDIQMLNGQYVKFYPHSDNSGYYYGYLSSKEYNKNEKNRLASMRISFTTTGHLERYTDTPFTLKINTGFINKQLGMLSLKINTGIY